MQAATCSPHAHLECDWSACAYDLITRLLAAQGQGCKYFRQLAMHVPDPGKTPKGHTPRRMESKQIWSDPAGPGRTSRRVAGPATAVRRN